MSEQARQLNTMNKDEKTAKEKEAATPDEKKPEANPQPPQPSEAEAEENPFDFGGLPKRDLKKNLGCG